MLINIKEALTSKPEQLEFIWPGFLRGTVGALVAPGAAGKSFWALQAAMCLRSEMANEALLELEINREEGKQGGVVYISAEDPPVITKNRISDISYYLPEESFDEISAGFFINSLFGELLDFMNDKHLNAVIENSIGARLIIIDTLSRVHTLDENKNGDMAKLLQRLEYMARMTGAGVLYVHHISKGAALNGDGANQHASRGASALTDNARYAASLVKMTEAEAEAFEVEEDMRDSFVRFVTTKANYSKKPQDQWYRRDLKGVLLPIKLAIKLPSQQNNKGGKKHDKSAY